MRNKVIVTFFLLPCLLWSDTSAEMFAEKIAFDGKNLTLSQGVTIKHPLGDFKANSIVVKEPGKDLSSPFSHAFLLGEVELDLVSGKKARCESAEIDEKAHKILLEGKDTLFFSMMKDEKEINLTCQSLNASYKPLQDRLHIQEMDAMHHVHFSCGPSSLTADALHIEEMGQDYLIQAFSQNKTPRCRLYHEESEIICARIQFETKLQEIFLEKPQGMIPIGFISDTPSCTTQFSSETLLWNMDKHRLSLLGDVKIDEKDVLSFATNQSMTLGYSKNASDDWSIDEVVSTGSTRITVSDPKEFAHEITCHSKIVFKKEDQKIVMESPLSAHGEMIEGRQIRYEGMNTAIYGTHGAIYLKEKQKKMGVSQIVLEGNIRLFSHDPKNSGLAALADEMVVHMDKQMITLIAKYGGKVLYVDEKEGVFVSAKKVVIFSPTNKSKKMVRAYGNVKFTFNAQENALLKKLFPYLHLNQNL